MKVYLSFLGVPGLSPVKNNLKMMILLKGDKLNTDQPAPGNNDLPLTGGNKGPPDRKH